MTIEKQIVLGLEDISAIRFECGQCGNSARWVAGKDSDEMPNACPFCGKDWRGKSNDLWKWAKQLAALSQDEEKRADFRVKIEASALDTGAGVRVTCR